jgi:nitric oxide reductase activation protein
VTTLRRTETDLGRFYALFPQPDLARDLFNLIEGHRIDTLIRRAYPGIRRDMDAIQAMSAERRPSLATLPDSQAVVEVLLQHLLGMTPATEDLAPAVRDLAEDARARFAAFPAEQADVAATARFTAELYELIAEHRPDPARWAAPEQAEEPDADGQPPEPEAADPPDPGEDDQYTPIELPPFMTPVMEELVKHQEPAPAQRQARSEDPSQQPDVEGEDEFDQALSATRPQASEGHSPDEVAQQTEGLAEEAPPGEASADTDQDESQGGGETPETSGPEVPQVAEEAEEDLGEQTFAYDEWDYRIEDYRPNWCTLRESRATRVQEGFVAATFHEFGGIVSQIRRNFQLMRPERMRKMRYQTEGDDLDTDGLVNYVVEKRARISPSGQVYIKRDKKERDVATAFLVDMSSSTDRKIDGRKRIIDIEKEGLLLMCEALEAIRDEYAIYGFSGSGREDCQFYVVKELGERYDDRVKGRIGGIYARQKTRMGPALRHATRRLAAADAAVKLMILLTDGKPYDSDTYQDNTYAQEDTKIALREARREKIHLFCVTVDQEGADYLPHMYSDANFVIIDDVRTLPHKLPQLYRRLTS